MLLARRITTHVLGRDHLATADSCDHLASVAAEHKQYEVAIKSLERALAIRRVVSGALRCTLPNVSTVSPCFTSFTVETVSPDGGWTVGEVTTFPMHVAVHACHDPTWYNTMLRVQDTSRKARRRGGPRRTWSACIKTT